MSAMRSPWKIISVLILLLATVGCGLADRRYTLREDNLGTPKETTVGSLMMAWECGTTNYFYGSAVRKALYYRGIEQNIVYIHCRRQALYSNGSVGQPRDQELKYDISNTRVLTIEEVTVQIANADPQKIRYTVVKGPAAADLFR